MKSIKRNLSMLVAGAFAVTSSQAVVVLNDNFSYPNGSLVTVAPGLWNTHSGTTGQVDVAAGQVNLSQTEGEDVNRLLAGQPYNSGNLYYCVTVVFTALPSAAGGNFIHLKETGVSLFRARIYASTSGAAVGSFRVGIANFSGTTPANLIPTDLALNVPYRLVVRYNVNSQASTLWINPASEFSMMNRADGMDAAPAPAPAIVSLALRQAGGIGVIRLDDLIVGTSFADCVPGPVIPGAPERFFTNPNLPPPEGQYVSPAQFHVLYQNGIILSNVSHRRFTQNLPPPPLGATQTHVFASVIQAQVSGGTGAPVAMVVAPANVAVRLRHVSDNGPTQLYETEMLQLQLTGLPGGMMVRESPTLSSLGQTTIRPVPGGHMISSFFDIFTELSIDGGANWVPSQGATRVELKRDPTTVPPIPAPSPVLPPPNDKYVSPAEFHIAYQNGIILSNASHKFFTRSLPPPPPGVPQMHQFDSQVDVTLHRPGMAPQRLRAPAMTEVMLHRTSGEGVGGEFDTEMTALSISGGDLPPGVMVREDPDRMSEGGTSIQPAPDGTFSIGSFFDVFTEISTDGGAMWSKALNPAHVELICDAPEFPAPSPDLPPPTGEYVSPADYHAALAAGIVIKDISHQRFLPVQPPPPPGGKQIHNFDSIVVLDVSTDGGTTFNRVTAPATVQVCLSNTLRFGNTDYFDTEMLQLNIEGGGLPNGIRLRESPTRASLGRTSIRQVGAAPPIWDYISSFFDVFTEISVAGGPFQPSDGGPTQVTARQRVSPPVSIMCPADITVQATSPAGAVVNFVPIASGGCDPVPTISCAPSSGSTFPVGTTVVSCTASDSCGQSATCAFSVTVTPQPVLVPEIFFPGNVLPPPTGVYISPQLFHQLYQNGIIIKDVRHRRFLGGTPPPPPGGSQVHTFDSTVEFKVSMDGGATFQPGSAPAMVSVRVNNVSGPGTMQHFDTEMLQLDIMGGSLPAGWMIRESPTRASMGHTTIRPVPGGFMIGSFFDVFTELTVPGQPPSPANDPAHVELRRDPALVPPVPGSTPLLPPRNDVYISPAQFHQLYAQGIIIKDVRHAFFTQSLPPPPPGGTQIHEFDSQVDMMVSQDGGNTFQPARAPAFARVQVASVQGSGNFAPAGLSGAPDDQLFDTEMLALDIMGGDLPPGVAIRESPTLPSRGGTLMSRLPDGSFAISSFFDVFTELDTGNGQGFVPATSGPARVELICEAPPIPAPSPNLPPADSKYVSPREFHALYQMGIVIKDVRHSGFTANMPPPPPGGSQVHNFGSTVEFMLSTDGGTNFSPASAPATVAARVTHVQDFGATSFFDTEMLSLNIGGGTLPAGVLIRESPTRASLGRTSIQRVTDPTGVIWDYISSFFDIFTELSLNNGVTWLPAQSPPVTVVLEPCPPPPTNTIEIDRFTYSVGKINLIHPDGTLERIVVAGPSTVEVLFEGAAEGVADDDDGDGLDEVTTCMTQLMLTGMSSRGPVTVMLDPTQPTKGEIEEKVNGTPGVLDLKPFGNNGCANSYFDVRAKIVIQTPTGPIRLCPAAPLRIESMICCKPPGPGESYMNLTGTTTALLDCATGNPTGFRLTGEMHTPNPRKETDVFSYSIGKINIKKPDGTIERIVVAGPTTVEVCIDDNPASQSYGLAADTDGDGFDQVPTTMIQLMLTGNSSMGPVMVMLDPSRPTTGEIEEKTNSTPGVLDLAPFASGCANSHFNVNALIKVGGQVLHTADPLRLDAMICHKPPLPGESYMNIFTTGGGGNFAPQGPNPCVVMDNGSGTVFLPPVGCQYLSPDEVHMIIDGLPAGTTIELATIHKDFICREGMPACTNNCFATDGCDPSDGETEAFNSSLQLQLTGTGGLAGFNRNITIPNVFCQVQSGPRTPGSPVQSFATDMMAIQGQIIGDPDFDLLRVTAGTSFGLPSPGHTTLTRQGGPGSNWAVDSFFDITYRIDFVGAPGGALAGRSGSTTGTIRMQTGNPGMNMGVPLLDTNGNPTGFFLTEEMHTPNPPKETDVFSYSIGKINIKKPDGTIERVVVAGPTTVEVCIDDNPASPGYGLAADTDGDGLDQVPTRMTQLMLQGNSSMGPVMIMLDPNRPTTGEIEEQVNLAMGQLDLAPFGNGCANSHFNVNALIKVGGQVLHTAGPLRLDAVICHKPPLPGESYMNIFTTGGGGNFAPQSPNPCVVPDNGSGTVTLPPAGCEYLTADEVHMIVDGLPAGTTIEVAAIHKGFFCPTNNTVCSFAPPPGLVRCEEPGGSLGGEKECSGSTLELNLNGTGALAGFNRTLNIAVGFETHIAPRTPGQPVQSFDTDMFRLFGQIIGDPDFDLLRIVAGTDFGLPSPGHTTLTQLPGGNWAVDSFFDITYRIDFVGAPGGPLAGRSGSTTGTIRMQTGNPGMNMGVPLLDANGNPTGFFLTEEMHTPNPRKEIDVFPSTDAQITLQLPDGNLATVNLTGPTTVEVCIDDVPGSPNFGLAADTDFDGLDQVPTRMTQLNLTGTSPLGPVVVTLNPARPTVGEIEETLNLTMGTLDLPPFTVTGSAFSTFDVFFQITVAGQTYHNEDPIQMQAFITHKPPGPGESYTNPFGQPIQLFDANGRPTGIFVVREVHTPNPEMRCPRLRIERLANGQVKITWPGPSDCVLQCARRLGNPGEDTDWNTVPGPYPFDAATGLYCVILDAVGPHQFYRLCKPPRPVITAVFTPTPGCVAAGDIVTIVGTGFGNCPDNICAVLADAGGPRFIPLDVLSSSMTRITARMGIIPPDAQPGPIMISQGRSETGRFRPAFFDVFVADDVWTLRRTEDEAVGVSPTPLKPVPTNEPPRTCWFFSEPPTPNGELCIVLDKPWPSNACVTITGSIDDDVNGLHVELNVPALIFPNGLSAVDCAERILDSIRCAWLQLAGFDVLGQIIPLPTGGVKIVFRLTPPGQITRGHITICVTQKPPPPVVTGVFPPFGGPGDIIRVRGTNFPTDPNDICMVVLEPPSGNTAGGVVSQRFLPLRVIAAQPGELQAVVGILPPDARPGPIMVGVGQGAEGRFQPAFGDIVVEKPVWVWHGGPNDPKGMGGNFNPQPTNPPPNQCWFFSQEPQNGMLCVFIDKDWPSNAVVSITARAHDSVSGAGGSDLDGPTIRLIGQGSRLECAEKIADVLRCAFLQQAGVMIEVMVQPLADGRVKITVKIPGGFIDRGMLNICVGTDPAGGGGGTPGGN